eukprot:scaffold391593_cov17-Prasinocladus_malaysianus.AAC.1
MKFDQGQSPSGNDASCRSNVFVLFVDCLLEWLIDTLQGLQIGLCNVLRPLPTSHETGVPRIITHGPKKTVQSLR